MMLSGSALKNGFWFDSSMRFSHASSTIHLGFFRTELMSSAAPPRRNVVTSLWSSTAAVTMIYTVTMKMNSSLSTSYRPLFT